MSGSICASFSDVRGLSDVLLYTQLAVTGTLERDMHRLHGPFMHLIEPGQGWSNRPLAA